jgi:uncharacterized membrane protein
MKMIPLLILAGLTGLTALATGCEDIGDPTGATCDQTLTYDNFGHDFMAAYCTGCHSAEADDRHGAPGGVNFDTEADVQSHAADIDRAAGAGPKASNDFMPDPEAPDELTDYHMPADSDREMLAKWIACEM